MREEFYLIIYRVRLYLLWSIALLYLSLIGHHLGFAQDPAPVTSNPPQIITPHSATPSLPSLVSTPPARHILVSLARFEKLQASALSDVELAEWSKVKVSLD